MDEIASMTGSRQLSEGRRRLLLAAILVLATAVLSVGITHDYRLKHEDNNALYATIARSHLLLGLSTTRGQDLMVQRDTHQGTFYAHHPPGIGLILAGAMAVTGYDDPPLVRGVAIAFHLLSLLLFYRILRQVLGEHEALLGALLFAILPEAAFFGRMLNHEPMALPALLLMVERYLAYLRHGGRWRLAAMTLAAAWGALVAWLAFFAIAACAAHAALGVRRGRSRAGSALVTLLAAGIALFALDLVHIGWVLGWDYSDLLHTLTSRSGAGGGIDPVHWLSHQLDLHRRYFTGTGLIALIWLAFRVVRGGWRTVRHRCRSGLEPAEEVAAIFLLAGIGYLLAFNAAADKHHYWQFVLLPADAIAMVLLWRRVTTWVRRRKGTARIARAVVPAVIVAEVLVTSAITLYSRHTTVEPYCVQTVATIRQELLDHYR